MVELEFLDEADALLIDEAIGEVLPFGQVRLIVEGGRLVSVRTLQSSSLEYTLE